jgi:hypothetical protein
MAREKKPGITIFRSTDRDGATYALAQVSREAVKAAFATVHLPPRVFIAHETHDDYQRIHGSMRSQIIQLLTGVDEDRLVTTLGAVRFCDPVTEREIAASPDHR